MSVFISKVIVCFVAVLLVAGILPTTAFAAVSYPVTIDATNFPDGTFRNYVLQNADTNRDGRLSEAEADAVRTINLNSMPLASLQGLEYFTKLQTLSCVGTGLQTLNVSQNTALVNLDCRQNLLTTLDVSANTAINYLACSENQLGALDVSSNTALVGLNCSYNNILSLDVSTLHDLRTFSCDRNQLTALDVTANTMLASLSCGENLFTSIDLSMNTQLTWLYAFNTPLSSLDLSANTKLRSLSCARNALTELDLSANPDLNSIDCSYNQLPELDLTGNTKLTSLNCTGNSIDTLDVSTNPNLVFLTVSNNGLTNLNLLNNSELQSVSCGNNLLTSLDLSGNPRLMNLFTSDNQLNALDLSNNPILEILYCGNNLLTALDLHANTTLWYLNCPNNALTNLDFQANTALEIAIANGNHLLDALLPSSMTYASLANQTLTVALQPNSSGSGAYLYESIDTFDIEAGHTLSIDVPDAFYDPVTKHIYTNSTNPVDFTTTVSDDFAVTGTFFFTSDTVVVTFFDWDGTTVLDTQVIPTGTDATPPDPPPTHPGYTFVGWSGVYTNVTEDSNVIATYENDTPDKFLVTFVDWDGTVIKQEAVDPGSDATPPTDPEREGYAFAGWDGSYTNVQEDTTVTAEYTVNSYTVEFLDWDDSVLSSQSVDYGGSALAPPDPEREGHTFAGWDNDYSNIMDDTTVRATYLINQYAIAFVDWDGAIIKQEFVDFGTDATPPDPPFHEGFAFVGWDGNYTAVAADGTVVATYTIQTYTVTFVDWDGSVLKTEVVDYGTSATPPGDPTREGYTFAGWSGNYVGIFGDTTITATYSANTPFAPVSPSSGISANTGDPLLSLAILLCLILLAALMSGGSLFLHRRRHT